MYNIVFSIEAEKNLRNIYEYITFNFKMGMIASKLIKRLDVKIRSLTDAPKRYKVFEEEPWLSRKLHYFYAENYAIFYIVNDDNNKVWIIRIMHQGMNYKYNLDLSSEHYFVSDHDIEEMYNENLLNKKLTKENK